MADFATSQSPGRPRPGVDDLTLDCATGMVHIRDAAIAETISLGCWHRLLANMIVVRGPHPVRSPTSSLLISAN